MRSLLNLTWLLVSLLLVPAQLALADDSSAGKGAAVKGEVLVILAKEEPGDYDAKLKQMPALQKAPFSAYKSMKVLSTTAVTLSDAQVAVVELPNGSTLQLKLLARMADGRHTVQVSISRPGKQGSQLTVNVSSEPFFVAGQSYQGGTLVIGVRVGEPPKK